MPKKIKQVNIKFISKSESVLKYPEIVFIIEEKNFSELARRLNFQDPSFKIVRPDASELTNLGHLAQGYTLRQSDKIYLHLPIEPEIKPELQVLNLKLLFQAFQQPFDLINNHKQQNDFELCINDDPKSLEKITGFIPKSNISWIKKYCRKKLKNNGVAFVSLPHQIIHAMKEVWLELSPRNFDAKNFVSLGSINGNFTLQCPGTLCNAKYLAKKNGVDLRLKARVPIDSNRIDSPVQAITLIAGLAKLNEIASI